MKRYSVFCGETKLGETDVFLIAIDMCYNRLHDDTVKLNCCSKESATFEIKTQEGINFYPSIYFNII